MKEEQFSNLESELKERGVYVSTTAGVSMKPMLRNRRDRVVLLPIGDKTLARWDLPIYRRPDGKYILHRVIDVKSDHYVIRGDNTYQKEYVKDAQIVGVVREFYRGDRHVLANARTYRAYAALWHFIFPLRRLLFNMRRLAGGIKRKIFH